MELFENYLVIINIIGAVLYIVNLLLYRFTSEGQIDILLTIASLLGGSLGMLLIILLFDRKARKENMMSRVFILCIFVIQVLVFLFIKGNHGDYGIYGSNVIYGSNGSHGEKIDINIIRFIIENKVLLYYLIIVNVITFFAFMIDKIAAIKKRSRIRIVTLLALCFFGGSLGGLSAMYLFHHKTKKDYFTVGVPLIIVMQIVVMFYFMNV